MMIFLGLCVGLVCGATIGFVLGWVLGAFHEASFCIVKLKGVGHD